MHTYPLHARRHRALRAAITCLVLVAGLLLPATPATARYQPGEPPGINPGEPTFTGSATPIPPEPAEYQPGRNMLEAIYRADVAAGGTSYWFDRILARPYLSDQDSALMSRGRALYMYTHNPRVLGFAAGGGGANGGGGYAYRQPPTTGTPRNLYTVAVAGDPLVEDTAQRVQYPSYFTAVFTRGGLSVRERKFITDNDVAVTDLTLTNTGAAPLTTTLTASSPIATALSPDGTELTGQVTLRYALSVIHPRLSGDGFTAAGTSLARDVTLAPGASVSLKVQLGTLADELPGSSTDYARYRGYDPDTAWRTQLREYNTFWVNTVPYLDIPDKNVEKISYYRTWLNRYNTFDGNIPGNDYQFPVDLEGALGYNNQISLTVPMRLQDLQFWRDPLYSYGSWLSQGEESGCQAFHDNPGNTGNWNNTYEQWTGTQAWQSYLVHGGPRSIVEHLAKYAECDLLGTLAKFDSNGNGLIEYSSGTLPGNDADSVAFKYYGTRPQDRTETSYWYSEAVTAAQEYTLLGNAAKARQMTDVANRIRTAILTQLWASGPVSNTDPGSGQATGPRVPGHLGNAVRLSGQNEYVDLPAGVMNGLNDYTVSVWVNPAATTTWSRVFDFGTGAGAYMFLTVNAGAGPRFAITTAGGGSEQQLSGTTPLPTGTWTHLAVTLAGSTGTLYVNGASVATNPAMTLRPSSLGNTTQNWIGRSQYDDPNLNATVDDFGIYGRALSGTEIGALAGGQPDAGDVASYRFDETAGPRAVDSSGHGGDATIVTLVRPTVTCPGKAFLQRDLTTGNLVCWKDQQNFAPFIDRVAPATPEYTQALRYYADKNEFPIMPVYTADQADQAADVACAACGHGTNNFSNINATLQARLYSTALRAYPSPYVTPDMYRQLISWLAWNENIGGDNRYPDNNEYFFNWDPTSQTFGRSGIHHDVLGSFNWMFYQDVAGLQPRRDGSVELHPIDLGYDHFTVNGLSYHGRDLTVVWQRPGGRSFYPAAPAGYSLYVDGERVFTVNDLKRVVSQPHTVPAADQVSLAGSSRLVDAFQRAGLDISGRIPPVDLAKGATATASFSTTSPAAQATNPANAVDGFTISGLPVVAGPYVGTNPIWGDLGSPNAQDWLQIDLGHPRRFDDVKLYLYSNKAFGAGGNTYREPAAYTVQILVGSSWVDVPGRMASPATPAPNYNDIPFPPVVARHVRVLLTRSAGYAVGVKEIQVFDLKK